VGGGRRVGPCCEGLGGDFTFCGGGGGCGRLFDAWLGF